MLLARKILNKKSAKFSKHEFFAVQTLSDFIIVLQVEVDHPKCTQPSQPFTFFLPGCFSLSERLSP